MNNKKHHISLVWDFDKTLTPIDSTDKLIRMFLIHQEQKYGSFWKKVKHISGTESLEPSNSISTSDAPVWMHLLSEMAYIDDKPVRLDETETFDKLITPAIPLFKNVINFLKVFKKKSNEKIYKENNIEINHFIITAGIGCFIESIMNHNNNKSPNLITHIFGCHYRFISDKNIPIYCMDKTTKTRSLFEISKGCFKKEAKYKVDDLVSEKYEWCPFQNMIYIGDGDTDIPAFSLVKSKGGMSIGVFDPKLDSSKRNKNIRKGKRIDLFTPADFSEGGDLFKYINMRCEQIAQRYMAQNV